MYYPTIRSIKREYTLLNKRVFNGCLPDSSEIEFQIGNMTDAFGICKYIITRDTLAIKVLPEFKDRDLFVAILAHEMVHRAVTARAVGDPAGSRFASRD